MTETLRKSIKPYLFPTVLISSILLGGLTGCLLKSEAHRLKFLGDIFLNLIFTAIVPLIFFSVSSAIANTGSLRKLGKIMTSMLVVFLFTGIIASLCSLVVVTLFPPALGVNLHLTLPQQTATALQSSQIVGIFTVSDFSKLLSHDNILALIVFSALVGLAVAGSKGQGRIFSDFLKAGEQVFMRVFSLIMFYAPIGFFGYFAALVSDLGPQLLASYFRVSLIYYVFGLLYFIFGSTFYAYLAAQMKGIKSFWSHVFLPLVTALATCSSAASIPANLLATQKMGVPPEIAETTVPLGAIIHKDGSVIGGVFKIAFLFGVFNLDFVSPGVLLTALGVSLLVGTVMGAIPSGGMLGELLILTCYGFPPSVLIAIAAISIIIDPLATMISVTNNSVSAMLIARLVDGKTWYTGN